MASDLIPNSDLIKKWKLGTLSLIGAAIGAASFASAPLVFAEAKEKGVTEQQAPEPTEAEKQKGALGGVRTLSARKVRVATRDSDPGGRVNLTLTWSGPRPYKVRIDGNVADADADGHCARAFVWGDTFGQRRLHDACTQGVIQGIHTGNSLPRANSVLVKVCLVRAGVNRHCSDWT